MLIMVYIFDSIGLKITIMLQCNMKLPLLMVNTIFIPDTDLHLTFSPTRHTCLLPQGNLCKLPQGSCTLHGPHLHPTLKWLGLPDMLCISQV